MKLKNLETENFRVSGQPGSYEVKATTTLARAYLRLKKLSNPVADGSMDSATLLDSIAQLEAGVAKLAAI